MHEIPDPDYPKDSRYTIDITKGRSGRLDRQYYFNHLQHREGNKPAKISFDSNGRVDELIWHHMGKRHRDHGPAMILFYRGGESISVHIAYYRHGKYHNPCGPSIRCFDLFPDGRREYLNTQWHIDGQAIPEYAVRRWFKMNNITVNDLRHTENQLAFKLALC